MKWPFTHVRVAASRASHLPRTQEEWLENRPATARGLGVDLTELWMYRELLFAFAIRDLKLRYTQTLLGVAWAIIQPLSAAVIFSVVFGHLTDFPSDGLPYPIFVYAGLVVWTYFATGVAAAAESLAEQRALVTRVYFPRIIAPAAAVIPGIVDMVMALGILAVLMAWYGVVPGFSLLLLPPILGVLILVTFGVGLWLSALNVLYRDVRYVLGFAIQLWLFASPVVFPNAIADGAWRWVLACNPLAGVIAGFRWSVLGGTRPGIEVLLSLATLSLTLLGGGLYFRRVEQRFSDVI